MAEMEPIENLVKRDRIAASKRPDSKFPLGRLNIIGDYAYAYSGEIDVAGDEIVLTDIVLGHKFLVGTIQVGNKDNTGDDYQILIKINGTTVFTMMYFQTMVHAPNPVNIIVNGGDRLQITAENVSNSNSHEFTATISGELFNA